MVITLYTLESQSTGFNICQSSVQLQLDFDVFLITPAVQILALLNLTAIVSLYIKLYHENLRWFYYVVVEINGCEVLDFTSNLGWSAHLGGPLAWETRYPESLQWQSSVSTTNTITAVTTVTRPHWYRWYNRTTRCSIKRLSRWSLKRRQRK